MGCPLKSFAPKISTKMKRKIIITIYICTIDFASTEKNFLEESHIHLLIGLKNQTSNQIVQPLFVWLKIKMNTSLITEH